MAFAWASCYREDLGVSGYVEILVSEAAVHLTSLEIAKGLKQSEAASAK